MSLKAVGFVALLFAALVLIPSGAHLAELPNKWISQGTII
jgi:hypothetical protein